MMTINYLFYCNKSLFDGSPLINVLIIFDIVDWAICRMLFQVFEYI